MTHLYKVIRQEVDFEFTDRPPHTGVILEVREPDVFIHGPNREHIWVKHNTIKKCMYKGKDITKEDPDAA